MDIVILLGAPGSGKGTIAGRLASEDANLKHVSSGDLLRGAVAKGTPAGQAAKAAMEAGQLVADEIIAEIIKDVIAETQGDVTILLDGFRATSGRPRFWRRSRRRSAPPCWWTCRTRSSPTASPAAAPVRSARRATM